MAPVTRLEPEPEGTGGELQIAYGFERNDHQVCCCIPGSGVGGALEAISFDKPSIEARLFKQRLFPNTVSLCRTRNPEWGTGR
jgi:hypothetical protein